MHSRSHTWSPGAPFLRVNGRELSVSFFQVSLGLPAPRLPSICISHAVLIAPLERSTCQNQRAFSLSKWGRGPKAQALPVIRLTLPWPHPLAWYCRSVWSWPYHCAARAAGSSWSVAKFHWHGAWPSACKSCTHGHVSCKRGGGMWELVVAPWTSSRLFSHK